MGHAAPTQLHIDSLGAGPPLVLLHGWAMHSGVWGALIEHLAERFRVHAVDLPGHGRSAAIMPWNFDGVVARVRSLLQHESQPLTLVGWSLGGMIALCWAHRDRERIARLVLVATTPRMVAASDWHCAIAPRTLARFGDELRVSYRLTLLRFLTLQLSGTDDGRAALAALRRRFFERGQPSREVLCDALATLGATDLRDIVREVRQASLVIAGNRDTVVPFTAGEWLATSLPRARFACIDGAAHVPFLSHPVAFQTALAAFLNHD